MPDKRTKAVLNDIGTEELAHLEMVGTLVNQLTKNATIDEIKRAGLQAYYTDHGLDVYPQSASGVQLNTMAIAAKGDPIANLQEDLAAEQKARATYEKLIDLSTDNPDALNVLRLIDLSTDNPDALNVLRYLREREVVHFQRFGETLRNIQDELMRKRCFSMNTKNNCGN